MLEQGLIQRLRRPRTRRLAADAARGRPHEPRTSSTPTLVCVGARSRARSCRASSLDAPGRGRREAALQEARRCSIPRRRPGARRRRSASATSSTPSALRVAAALAAKRGRDARGALARLGRCPTGVDAGARRRGARRGHDPRLLPLRPLPRATPTTTAPRASSSAWIARRRRADARRSRPRRDRRSPPRPPTAPATSRTCPRTRSPRRPSPTAPSEIAAAHEQRRGRGARPRGDRAPRHGRPRSPSRRAPTTEPRLIVAALRRRRRRRADRARRQGGDLRHRRDLDQALGAACTR